MSKKLTLFFLSFLLITNLYAQDIDATLELKAEYTFTYYWLDVYTVKLYLPQNVENKDVLNNINKRLEFTYHRNIKSKVLVEKAIESLERNPEFSFEKYEKELKAINDKYENVNDGDMYILSYDKKEGISLIKGNKDSKKRESLVTVRNSEFAKYYYGIWLSKYALGKGVYNALVLKKA